MEGKIPMFKALTALVLILLIALTLTGCRGIRPRTGPALRASATACIR